MHGSDFPALVCQTPPADCAAVCGFALAPGSSCLTPALSPHSSYALHTPPLRYDVASLEHWLDLNA
jgi:hypothetical protein